MKNISAIILRGLRPSIWLIPVCLLLSCSDGSKYHIKGEMYFIHYHNMVSNIYYGGDMAVVPCGVDSAFWDSSMIVAKGDSSHYSLYDFYSEKRVGDSIIYVLKDKPQCDEFYFVIDPDKYAEQPSRQELSSGFTGPLSKVQVEQLYPGILKGKKFIGLTD